MNIIDFILHIDEHLRTAITQMGNITYLLIFLIIFAETGLVVLPFLPGDSLLFAAGALAGGGLLNLWLVMLVMLAAAIVGDAANYWIGHKFGKRAFAKENARFFKPAYLAKTQDFYEKHGGKTVIMARFLPIVRTFAPFVAGVGGMQYRTFFAYNVVGALLWVISLTLAGYFFGSIPFIKDNFEFAVIGIIVLSIVPTVFELIKHRNDKAPDGDATDYDEIKGTFTKNKSPKDTNA